MSRFKLLIINLIMIIVVSGSCLINVNAASTDSTFGYRLLDNSDLIEITSYSGNGGYVAVPDYIDGQQVSAIGDRTFMNRHDISIVFIPDTITRIGLKAFEDDSALNEVTLPYNLEEIGNKAFYDCVSLTSVVIPQGTQKIGESCFEGCRKLTSVFMPESVTEIGSKCFKDCENLTVYCYSGSYAESYCDQMNIHHKSIKDASYNPYEYAYNESSRTAPYVQSQGVSWIIYFLCAVVIIVCIVLIISIKLNMRRGKSIIAALGRRPKR
ncbi:MAG: leucine-rich repeat domain-containing protein [Acutalibacteraceae bacterium]